MIINKTLLQAFQRYFFAYMAVVFCLLLSWQSIAQQSFSGINAITFFDSNNDKPFVGNGFLIKYKKQLFAVTVKHTLLEAKTKDMTHVVLKNHVKEWRIHPNHRPNQFVQLGKLLNSNPSEKIDMKVLNKDWLVFEVKQNNSPLALLTLRDTPLTKGEQVTAYGCSYHAKENCQQDQYQGIFIADEDNNLRISMKDLNLSTLRGLSGSPVLDNNQQVVGIVSNVLPAKSGKGFDFAPANLHYLIEILEQNT